MKKSKQSIEPDITCMKDAEYGADTVLPMHKAQRSTALLPQFENDINDYLRACNRIYSEIHQRTIKSRCAGFLRFLQNRGVTETSDISYEDIHTFHVDNPDKARINRMLYESSIKPFLSHLADRGICSPGLCWYLHYLQDGRIVTADAVAENQCKIPKLADKNPLPLTAAEYRSLSEDLLSVLKDDHLSAPVIAVSENTLKLHFIYLEMNSLVYSYEQAISWVYAVKEAFKSSWPTAYRAVRLFDDYARTGILVHGKSYESKPKSFDLLPEWCKAPITEFLDQRIKAKMALSTTKMDLTTCVRFCAFLAEEGLNSFKDITPAIVKDFNIKDTHKTAAGKGAYNSRIRRFLKFLARKGYAANTALYQSLGGPAASSERIVITLNETEKGELKAFNASAESALEKRDKACVLLGTEMGIRGCDIVNLKFRDINWKDWSIRFQQEKTEAEVWLAMPVSVGNAIYQYLKESRPREVKCDNIFVTIKAPYRKLSPVTCGQTLRRALPDRKVEGSGFHVTRKTFATERLRNNVNPDQIANAIGHATLNSIAPYLSLDDGKMGLCPLSVEDFGLQMNGGFSNG